MYGGTAVAQRSASYHVCLGGRALDGLGARCWLPTPTKPRMPRRARATSEAAGANLGCREGNNPDRRLRSLSACLVGKVVGLPRQPGGWLESSHPCKMA